MEKKDKRTVGVVGYGHLGEYLVERIQKSSDLELGFVWNRSSEVFKDSDIPPRLILRQLDNFTECKVNVIVEVAHPVISEQFGEKFLQHADYLIGSPTALADSELEQKLRLAANTGKHGLYVPSGAFWGGDDIAKMSDRGTLKALKVCMSKHPSCFRLHPDLQQKLSDTERVVLYEGPVRGLCPLAPNNVNTMAAAAIAARNLGFDQVQAKLIADPRLSDWHIVEVDVTGPGDGDTYFQVNTVRKNPANIGVVTGNATYASFYSSLLGAHGRGSGVHLC